MADIAAVAQTQAAGEKIISTKLIYRHVAAVEMDNCLRTAINMNSNETKQISYLQSITPTQLFSAYSSTWDETDETYEMKSLQKGFLQSLSRTELQRAWIGYQQNGQLFPLGFLRNFFVVNDLPVQSTETTPQDRAAMIIQRAWRNMTITTPCTCNFNGLCVVCNEFDPQCGYHCSDIGCANHDTIEYPEPRCRRGLCSNCEYGEIRKRKTYPIHYVYYHSGIEKCVVSCRPLKRWQLLYTWATYDRSGKTFHNNFGLESFLDPQRPKAWYESDTPNIIHPFLHNVRKN